jgi:PAS domain S-box-containing protein
MKTPTLTNHNLQTGHDSAILSVLPFPAFVFDITTCQVLKSNAYFYNENNCAVLFLLTKYGYIFIDNEDLQKIILQLINDQSSISRKVHETYEGRVIFEVHAYLLPDKKFAFFYLNQLSDHRFPGLTSEIFAASGEAPGITECRYKQLVNKLSLGVYRTSAKGRFIFINSALAKILEYDSVEELYELSVSDLFLNPAERIKQLERWKETIINADEIQLKTKNGRIIHVKDIGLGIYNKSGEVEFFEGIIEDITNRVVMEQELIQARDKALEADRLKTTFLTNMSHEIRTPMNSILGFSSMLKGKSVNYRNHDRYLDIIISRSKHLMQVLNDILDITKIEEGQVSQNPESFILNDFLEQLYKTFFIELDHSDKHLNLILTSPLPVEDSHIISDQQHLQKIFSNLLSNSLKFSTQGFIEFGYTLNSKNELLFFVKDSGIGISPILHEQIFERFRQADESFTRDYGGLGLGLSICKGLVKLMNGNIWVESDGHSGATFYFTIAYSKKIHHANAKEKELSSPLNLHNINKYVLVIEDDPSSYEYLFEVLSSIGCCVLQAKTGKEALEIFSQHQPVDLILLDIQLPGLDGYEIARKIRSLNKHIPIIAQTAHAFSENKRKCIEAGCNHYLTKPIPYDILLHALKEYLDFEF